VRLATLHGGGLRGDVRIEPSQLELRLRHVVERSACRLPRFDRAHDLVDDVPVLHVGAVDSTRESPTARMAPRVKR
jgi:hypothetical protein